MCFLCVNIGYCYYLNKLYGVCLLMFFLILYVNVGSFFVEMLEFLFV